MTPATPLSATAQKRILAFEWEANREQLRCALGFLPRPCEEPSADLMASIRRVRQLLPELERLHDATTRTLHFGDYHSTGERVSAFARLSP